MKYSIIIANYNGIEHIVKCVNSIFSCSKDFELIVVDNGSTDGSKGYLQELKARNENVKIISNPGNTTFSIANNQGIKLAEGEYIVFLNNDTVVCKDWLERINVHFFNVPLNNIGIVGPVSSCSNGQQMVGVQNPEIWHQENHGRWVHAGRLFGWCMMMPKKILDEIGGFDERFVNSHEDNDLCLRAQLAGYKLVIAYDTYIYHAGQGTLRKIMSTDQYLESGYKNRELYYNKYYDPRPKKLVAVYRTNGGKWLEESLRQTSKFADSILIHFCRSPQLYDTRPKDSLQFQGDYAPVFINREQYSKVLKDKFPKIKHIEFYDGIFQEDYERGRLLELALEMHANGEADWCISIDDDEIYEDKFIERAQKMMTPRNPEVFGYWCNWKTIWDKRGDTEYFRADSTFGQFTNYRFFKLMKGQRINSEHPEGHHCGSAPLMAVENVNWSNIRVKHMGYDTHEQRQKKYEFYQANDHFKDPRDIGNKDYSHLIDINITLEKYRPDNGISLIMMVKNEEDKILQCLEGIEPVIDEFVIVDTGSTDKTVKLIEDFAKYSSIPVKILSYPWENNYSTPRNFGKLYATKPWILMMDADEKFAYEDLRKIQAMTETEAEVVIFHVINYLKKFIIGEKPIYASTESARLYRNMPELFYTGIIHETIDDATCFMGMRKGLKIARAPVVLHHYGYLKIKERVQEKLNYYEELNHEQIEITEGKDPRPYFNLALHYLNDNKKTEALKMFQKVLEINPEFWHANQQMAALNIGNAKEFLNRTIGTIPGTHPFKGQAEKLLEFLNQNSFGSIKVGE